MWDNPRLLNLAAGALVGIATLLFAVAGFVRAAASFALNLAIAVINVTGIGSSSGSRIVPLLILYPASRSLNVAASRSPQG